MAWQKSATAFAAGITRNWAGKRLGSGSSPTQSRLFCWREAVNTFSRKFMVSALNSQIKDPLPRATLAPIRLGNAAAQLNRASRPTRLRRYCFAVRSAARRTVRCQPRRKEKRPHPASKPLSPLRQYVHYEYRPSHTFILDIKMYCRYVVFCNLSFQCLVGIPLQRLRERRYISTTFHFEMYFFGAACLVMMLYQGDRKGRPYNTCQYLGAKKLIHGVMMPSLSYSLVSGVEWKSLGRRNVI